MKNVSPLVALVFAMVFGVLLGISPAAAHEHGQGATAAVHAADEGPSAGVHARHGADTKPAHPMQHRDMPAGSCDQCPVAASCAPTLATVSAQANVIARRTGLKIVLPASRHLIGAALTRDPPVPRA